MKLLSLGLWWYCEEGLNTMLLKQVTGEEVWDVVNSIGALKAPGPGHMLAFTKAVGK